MADRKITQLPTIVNAGPSDLFCIVDVSDTTESPEGTSKKIPFSDISIANSEVLILDSSMDIFNSGSTGNVVVKQYTIPANSFKENSLLVVKCKVNRLLGSGNTFLTLETSSDFGQVANQKLFNGVNGNVSSRNIIMKDTTFFSLANSGSFFDDLDSPSQNSNFTTYSIDRSSDCTLDLQMNFTVGGAEYQLVYLIIEQISL